MIWWIARARAGWRWNCATSAADRHSSVDLLIVDGYDQFNALQANLLTVLGAQVRESLVALTTVPGREATIGRRFRMRSIGWQAAHKARGISLDVIPFTAREDSGILR